MKYGMVKGGVVVLETPSAFEEGATVTVEQVPARKAQSKPSREQVLKAIDKSPLRFTRSWDEIKKETL